MPKKCLQIIVGFDQLISFDLAFSGGIFDIRINEFDGKIMFPQVNNLLDFDQLLIAPLNLDNTLFENNEIEWGIPIYFSNKQDIKENQSPIRFLNIKHVLLSFEIVQNNNFEENCNLLYNYIKKWSDLFKKYIELITKQKVRERSSLSIISTSYNNIIAKTKLSKNEIFRIPFVKGPPSAPSIISIIEIQTINTIYFNYILDRCSKLEDVPMDINLINDARLEINSDFRKAIIDSSCAVEITLTRECQKKLRQMTNEGFSKSILDDKYKTLGNRLYLALLLGILVDDNYSKDIVSLRNKVIHEGYNPKLEETQLALKKCQKIVKQFSALKYFR